MSQLIESLVFERSVRELSGVGPAIEHKLDTLGIRTIGELIGHYPRAFADFSVWKKIADLRVGDRCSSRGTITRIFNRRTKRRFFTIQELTISDDQGSMTLLFFNQPYLVRTFHEGDLVAIAGEVSPDFRLKRVIKNPLIERITTLDEAPQQVGRILPIYPVTRGVSSRQLSRLLATTLERLSLVDPLPKEIATAHELLFLDQAIHSIHRPGNQTDLQAAQRRLAFDEVLRFVLRLRLEQKELSNKAAPKVILDVDFMKQIVSSLPFALVDSQRVAIWEILTDLAAGRPMRRLLYGEVGSGKTIVAACAALPLMRAGYQVLVLAPTEILVHQHARTLKFIEQFGFELAIVTGRMKGNLKANLLIGTQALLHQSELFTRLGMVIIDEQHRFGVHQRQTLISGLHHETHLLTLSATPIPRSLAFALLGSLSVSRLEKRAENRVTTRLVEADRQSMYATIRQELTNRHQVFVVAPVIDPIEAEYSSLFPVSPPSVSEVAKEFANEFPTATIAVLHGRLSGREKERIMNKFNNGEISILVSTSVIEVGIDVPNATVMVIEGADRFGLAALHQLRGRVGRGDAAAYCYMVPTPGLSGESERLQALAEISDGLALAEIDLKLRGPGEFFGTSQHGAPLLNFASLTDVPLIKLAQQVAEELLALDSSLDRFGELKRSVLEYGDTSHLE